MSFYKPAIEIARQADAPRQVGVAVFRNGKLLTTANNGHSEPCKRVGYPTGEGYDLCSGCDYPNHAEYKAVQGDVQGADLYMFGHYYACEPCKKACAKAGIKNIYIKVAT